MALTRLVDFNWLGCGDGTADTVFGLAPGAAVMSDCIMEDGVGDWALVRMILRVLRIGCVWPSVGVLTKPGWGDALRCSSATVFVALITGGLLEVIVSGEAVTIVEGLVTVGFVPGLLIMHRTGLLVFNGRYFMKWFWQMRGFRDLRFVA